MVDPRKRFGHFSSGDHCQRTSPSRISNRPREGFEPVQNLSSGVVEAEDERINLNAVCNIELPDTGVVILEGTIISQNLSRMEMTLVRDLNL